MTTDSEHGRLCEHGVAVGFGCSGCTLVGSFATDIAIWLRVHCHEDWTASSEPVVSLAARLVRISGHNGGGTDA